MNNHQIYSIAKLHGHTQHMFKYCITPDTCPTYVDSYPAAYVCNSENSRSSGKENGHWLAILFPAPNMPGEFFDSMGRSLNHYAVEIKKFLMRNGNGKYKVNSHSYQAANTKSCGLFCLWFLDQRGRKRSYEAALKLLSPTNLVINEQYITKYIMHHMTPNIV